MDPFVFRPIRRADFPLLGAWLRTAHVARWWADDPSVDRIEADYGGNVDNTEPSEVFIVNHLDRPIGLVQRYRLAAYPSYLDELEPLVVLPAGASSINYFIGTPEALGRGWGVALVQSFVLKL